MRKKTVQVLLGAALIAAMCLGAPTAAFADETTTKEETAEKTGDKDSAEEKETAEDFQIGELTVKNQSGLEVKSAELQDAKEDDSKKKDSKDAAGQDLVITMKDGTEHTFRNVTPDDWKEPVFYNEYEILYISYTDEKGKSQEALEDAKETELEEAATTYAKSNVNIREKADTKSKSLKVTSLGTEFKVTGVCPGWLKVEGDGVKGYAAHTYFTSNKDEIDKLVAEQKAAEEKKVAEAKAASEAQAAADAQAAAEAQAASEAQAAAEAAASEPTEVSRQAYDDCDGSGHGYYEITYSDGSVRYEEY